MAHNSRQLPTGNVIISKETTCSVERLIALLNSRPKLSVEEVERRYKAYFEKAFARMTSSGVTYGEATGAPGTAVTTTDETEFRKRLREIDDDLAEQVRIVTEGVSHYFENGEYPAPYYAWRIAVILRKTKEYELEREFLEAFSAKFADGRGKRYIDIGQRVEKARALANRQPTNPDYGP
jgi:hypothetical protein